MSVIYVWGLPYRSNLWPTWVKYACDSAYSFCTGDHVLGAHPGLSICIWKPPTYWQFLWFNVSNQKKIVLVLLILGWETDTIEDFSFSVHEFRWGDILVKKKLERERRLQLGWKKVRTLMQQRFGRPLLTIFCCLNKWSYAITSNTIWSFLSVWT